MFQETKITNQILISDFVKIFSEVNTTALISGDSFLIETVAKQLEELLQYFVIFLQTKDTSSQELNFQLSNIVTTLAIFSHLNRVSRLQFLRIERNVLLFRKSLFAFRGVEAKEKPIVIHKSNYFINKKNNLLLTPIQKRILGLIENGDEILNIEVFNHFEGISKRTLKRHLSQLISGGHINREAQGKKVYYKKASNDRAMSEGVLRLESRNREVN